MGNSLIYEYIIRSAFDVGRGAQHGANADLYRDWEVNLRGLQLQKEAIKNKTMPIDSRSIDELEYQTRVASSKVKNNIKSAILNVLKTPRPSGIEIKLKELNSMLSIDLYDQEKIDHIIDRIWDLFRELKLPNT